MAELERDVARALILSPEREVLLIRIVLPDRAFWITPGGGIDGREDPRCALERELLEETGVATWEIGAEIWTRNHTFEFNGDKITQHERFFLVHTDRFDPPDEMPDEIERQVVDEFRWWSLEEIAASTEDFAPRRLGGFLRTVLDGHIPDIPIDVGI